MSPLILGARRVSIVAYVLYPASVLAAYFGVIAPLGAGGSVLVCCGLLLAVLLAFTFLHTPSGSGWGRRSAIGASSLSMAVAYSVTTEAIPALLNGHKLLVPLWATAVSFVAGAFASDCSHGALELVRTVSSATKKSFCVARQAKEAVAFETKGFGAGWALVEALKHCQFELPRKLFPAPEDSSAEANVLRKLLHSGKQLSKEVYSWHAAAAGLIALHTHGDGNCLLHAASNSLWGIGDDLSSAKLRGAVVAAIRDREVKAKLWPAFRRSRCELGGIVVDMEDRQLEAEWTSLVANAQNFDDNSAEYLEDVHLLLLANVLRRPVLVYGESMVDPHRRDLWVENPLRGLYLPYLHKPSSCHWSPVVMYYFPSHFVSLVPLESLQERNKRLLCSITETESNDLLPVRLLPTSDPMDAMTLVRKYMRVHQEAPAGILAEMQTTQRTEFYHTLMELYLGAHGVAF